MPTFDKTQVQALEQYMYYSCVHDAKIVDFKYDKQSKLLTIAALNFYSNIKINFVFKDVRLFSIININDFGSCDTINSLTVEKDNSIFANTENILKIFEDGALYIMFQMFSGDEWHIISKYISIDVQIFGSVTEDDLMNLMGR